MFLSGMLPSAYAAPPGQEAYSESTDINKYLALGAVILVGGLIIWDILEDRASGGEAEGAALVDSSRIEPTGIDWNHLEPDRTEPSTVVVSILPVDNGKNLSRLILDELESALDPQRFVVSPEPIHLGGVTSPEDAFEMAKSYFDAETFLHSARISGDGVSISLLMGPRSALFTDTLTRADSTSARAAAQRVIETLSR